MKLLNLTENTLDKENINKITECNNCNKYNLCYWFPDYCKQSDYIDIIKKYVKN